MQVSYMDFKRDRDAATNAVSLLGSFAKVACPLLLAPAPEAAVLLLSPLPVGGNQVLRGPHPYKLLQV